MFVKMILLLIIPSFFFSILAESVVTQNLQSVPSSTLVLEEGFSPSPLFRLKSNDSTPSSILYWDPIDAPGKFSLLTIVVEHRSEGTWYMPSLHDKYSAGWNRSTSKGHLNKPTACNIRFFGIALASTLNFFTKGGSGYMTAHFASEFSAKGQSRTKHYWHGYDKNETNRLYCYYETNLGYGSEFKVIYSC